MKPATPVDDNLPKFFRVYMPGVSADNLELPVSFNSYLPKNLPKYVTVKSIYGKIWKMALRRCGGEADRYILLNGWKSIAKDESLNGGDVLEFEFDGSKCFYFCIYEPLTMCKRLKRSSVQSEEEEEETKDDDDVILEDVVADDDDDHHVVLDDSDDTDDDDERQYLDDRSNAFFPVTINPKKISQLRIPSKVINDYGLTFSESITLIDPLVNKFGKLSKKIKIQMNGSVFIKGYGAVIRRNGVKATDKMICELKKGGNNNMVHTIKFHVIK